jgi:hypothetical protein
VPPEQADPRTRPRPGPQSHAALAERHEGATGAALARLGDALADVSRRQSEAAARGAAEAAAVRGDFAELRAWFDANQVRQGRCLAWCKQARFCRPRL